MPTELVTLPTRVGWRVYVVTPQFDFYAYTVFGVTGPREAREAMSGLITPGALKLKVVQVIVPEGDLPQHLELLPL